MSHDRSVPVRTMCAMFGLNPNTIRTWERRYQFPSPKRGEGGHRSYSADDIELISRIVALIKSGVSAGEAIGQALAAPAAPVEAMPGAPVLQYEEQVLKALDEHDHQALTRATRRVQDEVGYKVFVEEYAFPVLNLLGRRWKEHGKGVAAEHAYTRIVANVVAEQAHGLAPAESARVMTFACVPGEQHSLPLLHLCNLIMEQKLARPIILSAGLPMDEIIDASRRGGAYVIVLSATIPPASVDTRRWVEQCVKAGWADRTVLVGPGFARSRVYVDYPVKAAAGGFDQTVEFLRQAFGSKIS